ncbi:MAG TPA: hypothetical protein VMW89_03700 [Desulfatiglandales bacterium]|nr:hypothetical protein [Desulfatiglandales bacterium]
MDVAEWQKRLEDNFTFNGVVGGNLFAIFDQERACGEYFANTFHGQCVLIDSFQGFYVETMRNARDWISANGWPKECEYYPPILVHYVIAFRSFRACENLLLKGYPLDGYALLRDLKDRCISLAGIAQNKTTFPALFGHKGIKCPTVEDWPQIKKQRKNEEHRVLNLMIRKNSGLPDDIIVELGSWEQLFHVEVHGSTFSFTKELLDWVQGKAALSLGPTPKKDSMAMYMNRACEVAWLLVRLLPYLEPEKSAFGGKWLDKQHILDESFRYMQQSLSKSGKKIGDAFIRFVEEKFSFGDHFFYFEADGTG